MVVRQGALRMDQPQAFLQQRVVASLVVQAQQRGLQECLQVVLLAPAVAAVKASALACWASSCGVAATTAAAAA
jgi:hypothetical protein